jgi:hypothetical protein
VPSAFGRVLLELRERAISRWGPDAEIVYRLPTRFDIDPLSGALNAHGWRAAIEVGGLEVASGVSNSGAGAQDALLAVLRELE